MKTLFRPTRLKAMSLVMALLTWGVVTQITDNEKTVRNVPVLIDTPLGLSVRDRDAAVVSVTFRGTREDLLLLDERTVQVQVVLDPQTPAGLNRLEILPRQVTHTSPKARITEIEPRSLEIRLGREGQKELPILVPTTGSLPRGHRVESIDYEPRFVVLKGADELLEGIATLQTSPVHLTDRLLSFEQRVDVIPPSPDWVGRIEPSRVNVRVNIAGLTEDRSFGGVPVMVYADNRLETPIAVEVEPQTVQVFLRGRPVSLDALRPEQIQAFVPASAAIGGEPAEVRVLAPTGLQVLGVQPSNVRLRPRPVLPSPTPPTPPEPAAVSP